jgi:hypothetical protein
MQRNAQHYFRSEDIFRPADCKKEDTVNSVQLKYVQKMVGKDWNVEMHVSPSREAIHCRQPRIQTGRQVKYTEGMPST